MPISTLIVTAGASNANSYVSIAVADQFFLDRPPVGATWDDAGDSEKTKGLLWATKLLDSLYEWGGTVVTETQALLWPRHGMVYTNGYTVPSTIIPVQLQHATAEFARQLLEEERTTDSDIETQGIRKLVAGPVELEFKDSVTDKVVPDAVANLIPRHWYSSIKGRASMTAELLRA